jgi:hypothetical protein
MRNYAAIVEAARIHYENLRTDIANAHNRVEHIRLSALAQEAHNLYTDLLAFEVGLVYSHTSNVNGYFLKETPLDLPDFKSPYTPLQ